MFYARDKPASAKYPPLRTHFAHSLKKKKKIAAIVKSTSIVASMEPVSTTAIIVLIANRSDPQNLWMNVWKCETDVFLQQFPLAAVFDGQESVVGVVAAVLPNGT